MNNQDYHKTINDYISNKWPDLQDSDITSLQARQFKYNMNKRRSSASVTSHKPVQPQKLVNKAPNTQLNFFGRSRNQKEKPVSPGSNMSQLNRIKTSVVEARIDQTQKKLDALMKDPKINWKKQIKIKEYEKKIKNDEKIMSDYMSPKSSHWISKTQSKVISDYSASIEPQYAIKTQNTVKFQNNFLESGGDFTENIKLQKVELDDILQIQENIKNDPVYPLLKKEPSIPKIRKLGNIFNGPVSLISHTNKMLHIVDEKQKQDPSESISMTKSFSPSRLMEKSSRRSRNKIGTINTNGNLMKTYKEKQIQKAIQTRMARTGISKTVAENDIKNQLRKQGVSVPSLAKKIDKFGREICPNWEKQKAQMKNPRKELHQKGQISLGEQYVYEKLHAIGHHYEHKMKFEVDSLLESAMNSQKSTDQNSMRVPQVSRVSDEDTILCNPDPADDCSVKHDQFSDIQDNGSSFSSNYSFKELENPQDIGSQSDIKKYCFFNIYQGIKLPLTKGLLDRSFTVQDIIDISCVLIRNDKRKKRYSQSAIEYIIDIYQNDFQVKPLELSKGFALSRYLIFQDQSFEIGQLNTIAVTIPYVLNLRYINLKNCNIKDEQAGYIFRSCRNLSKIQEIYFGQNQFGSKFIEEISHLNKKIQVLGIDNMIKSSINIPKLLRVLQTFKQLYKLDLSGNKLSKECTEIISSIVSSKQCLIENLNLSNCLNNMQATKCMVEGLRKNNSIKFLNLSCNILSHADYELASNIGRMIQIHPLLVHLDISNCKLSQAELIFITMCVRESKVIEVLHLGLNNIDYYGRLMLRHILKARVQYPFRANVQIMEKNEDTQMIFILNSYIMSNLPPEPKRDEFQKPIRNMVDVKRRINESKFLLEQNMDIKQLWESQVNQMDDFREQLKSPKEFYPTEFNNPMMKKLHKQIQAKINKYREINGKKEFKQPFYLPENSQFQNLHTNLQTHLYNNVKSLQRKKEIKQKGKDLLKSYFENRSGRIYDMINFLDLYGRKQHILTQKEFHKSDNQIIDELNQKLTLQRSLQKTKDSHRSYESNQDVAIGDEKLLIKTHKALKNQGYIIWQTNQCDDKKDKAQSPRDIQHTNLIKIVMQNQGFQDSNFIKRIKQIFRWAYLVNNVDELSRPVDVLEQDIIFQRYLCDIDVQGSTQWQDSSECWKCHRYQKIHININELDIYTDDDFKDIFQLTSIINQQTDQKEAVEITNNLFPVFEDMFENIQMGDTPKISRSVSSIDDSYYNEDSAEDSGEQTYKSQTQKNFSEPEQSTFEKIDEQQAVEKSSFYNFQDNSSQQFSAPIAQRQKQKRIKSALLNNEFVYNSNIQARPITGRQMQQQICTQAEYQTDNIRVYNKYSQAHNKKQINEFGVVYKEFEMNEILTHNCQSSDSESKECSPGFKVKKQARKLIKTVSNVDNFMEILFKKQQQQNQQQTAEYIERKLKNEIKSRLKNSRKSAPNNQFQNPKIINTDSQPETPLKIPESVTAQDRTVSCNFDFLEDASTTNNIFSQKSSSVRPRTHLNIIEVGKLIEKQKNDYKSNEKQKIIQHIPPAQRSNELLESQMSQNNHNWFQLKKTITQESSFHLMASFNHWFPIKMIKENQSQKETFSRQKSKYSRQLSRDSSQRNMTMKIESRHDNNIPFSKQRLKIFDEISSQISQAFPSQNSSKQKSNVVWNSGQKKQSQPTSQPSYKQLPKLSHQSLVNIFKKEDKNTVEEKKIEDHYFAEFVPIGKYYFYFVKDSSQFCLSKNYKVEVFPGSNIRMNYIEVEYEQEQDHQHHSNEQINKQHSHSHSYGQNKHQSHYSVGQKGKQLDVIIDISPESPQITPQIKNPNRLSVKNERDFKIKVEDLSSNITHSHSLLSTESIRRNQNQSVNQ